MRKEKKEKTGGGGISTCLWDPDRESLNQN